MAFQQIGLYIDRGSFNGDKSPTQLGEHSYRTSIDTLATVSAISFDNPYFPPFLNGNADTVQIGDLVEVSASDGFNRYKIIALSPFAMVTNSDVIPDPTYNNITTNTITFANTSTPPGPSQLSFYAEAVALALNTEGASVGTIPAVASRIGKMVMLNIIGFEFVAGSADTLRIDLPSWISPSIGHTVFPTQIASGIIVAPGPAAVFTPTQFQATIGVDSNTQITMFNSANPQSPFNIGDDIVFDDFTLSYNLA